MSRIVLVAVALVATLCTSSALAADLPYGYGSRQPYTVAQPLDLYSWAGPYIGGNLGWNWGGVDNNPTKPSGFVGGAQAGYNYLLGPVLLGGEIDFQGSTMTGGVTGGAGPSFISATQSIPWFSTFRVRAGYPVGSVMPYLTGGAVWGQQRLAGFDSQFGAFDNSSNFWTYTVGAGVEGHLNDRWSAKLEYLWIGTPDTPLSTPASTSISERSIGNLVRVGFNYRF